MISLAAPTLEQVAKGDPDVAVEFAKIGNDGMAELCQKYPDEFAGFVAQTPLTAKDAGVAETTRAINELGACGTQIFTNVEGKPLDRPEFRPFFAAMEKLDKPIWVHPSRGANFPDYPDREEVALRNLVDLRLGLRDRGDDVAPRVLEDPGRHAEAEGDRASLRLDRADAGRPRRSRAGISSARAPRTRITARC